MTRTRRSWRAGRYWLSLIHICDNIDIVIDNTKIHLFDKETEQTICN